MLIEKGIYFYVVGRDRNLFSMVHLDPSGNNFLSGTFEIGNHFNKTWYKLVIYFHLVLIWELVFHRDIVFATVSMATGMKISHNK